MPIMNPEEVRKSFTSSSKEEGSDFVDIPPLTQLSIDVKDDRGKRYKGTFVFKVPTLGDQVEIGRLKTAYLPQGSQADRNAALLVEQVCYLEVTIQKDNLPVWWKPFELYDAAPVTALYAEAIRYERRFHNRASELRFDHVGDDAPAEEPRGDDAPAGDAVGADVQRSPKRPETLVSYSKGTHRRPAESEGTQGRT